MDFVSVLLAFLVILIFMAIFTLLRTMNSPYIQRFEGIVKAKIIPFKNMKDSYWMKFNFDGRVAELHEMNFEVIKGQKAAYNKVVFLKLEILTEMSIRFVDPHEQQNVNDYYNQMLGYSQAVYQANSYELGEAFQNVKIMTNDVHKLPSILNDPKVQQILSGLKLKSQYLGELIPVVVEPGQISLHYSLSDKYLGELNYNPRLILEHLKMLFSLAVLIEGLDQGRKLEIKI